jgi:glycosyltransferase involved in cell wall biosynthesis
VRIAQICPRYYPDIGGVETHVKEISERLVARGFEVEVICTVPTARLQKHEIINGVAVTRFRSFAPGDAYYFAPQIYVYLKAHSYDIIHAHSYHALPALFAALAKNERCFIFTPHYHREGHTLIRNMLHKPYKLIGRKIFEWADKVICVSEYEKRNVISDFTVPPGKIEKIPNGLNLAGFVNIKPHEKHNSERTLLYVGRLEKYKGIQHIIKVLPHLQDFKLEIIGKGPYENALRKLAEELSVTERINWYKNITREEMLQHYASADVFLMLSTHEAYGITVAEALMSGTPCIVAMGSALDEFVDGERCIGIETPIITGRLVKTVQQLKNAGTKGKMDTKNLPFADWNEVTDRLIELYRGVQ